MRWLCDFLYVVIEYRLGDLASMAALPITIVGFGIAFRQIQKTKSSSEAAKTASEAVRQQIHQMNAIQGVGAAIRTLEDIRRLHRIKAWSVLPDRYTSLKSELISIRGRTPDLADSVKSEFQGAIQQITLIERQVEEALAGVGEPEINRINDVISEQIDRFAQVLADLQNQIETLEK
jgi:hypothetical protein